MKVIINADDFGASTHINKSIYKSLKGGYLTSSTIMAVGDEVEESSKMTKEFKNISYGIHLALTGDFTSLSTGEKFNESNWKFNRLNIFQIPKIVKEFSLQIEKLKAYGIDISHMDTHEHIHRYPIVLCAVIYVAKKYKIDKIRTQVLEGHTKGINGLYRSGHSFILRLFGFKVVDSYMRFATFNKNIVKDDNKIKEIMCHPGSSENDEQYFTQEFYSKFRKNLISYKDL